MRRLAGTAFLLALAGLAFAQPGSRGNFMARLSGGDEVPPNESRAHGIAHLRLDNEGLRYRLNVSNIDNVIAAHIHLGAPTENGPVVAFLFGAVDAGGGAANGKLSEGVIRAADLTGPLAGETLDRLLAEIRAGNTYVNVHTDDGVEPSGTGPGDLPGGEIRGQIRAAGSQGAPSNDG